MLKAKTTADSFAQTCSLFTAMYMATALFTHDPIHLPGHKNSPEDSSQ